jgi:hypothetical protein
MADLTTLQKEIHSGCGKLKIPDSLIGDLSTRLVIIYDMPWTIKQQSGSCGFTSLLMAMFYLFEPDHLHPLFKTIFSENLLNRLWKRYSLFFKDATDHTYMLDYFLTVGMMLVFKDKGTKLQVSNPYHKQMWLDCIQYSIPFESWELNPYRKKLKDIISSGSAGSIDKDSLSFKKGDLALVFNGLMYEADAWFGGLDHIYLEGIKSPEPPPITPLPGFTQLCEIVGAGPASLSVAKDKKMFKATEKWDNVYHWVFRPRWQRPGIADSEREIWSWGRVYKKVRSLGGDYSERLSIRIYSKMPKARPLEVRDCFVSKKLSPIDNSSGVAKFVP